jgi:hypothetical protein
MEAWATWYDYGDGNPTTACNTTLDPHAFTVATPTTGPLSYPCFSRLVLCGEQACVLVLVTDHIPKTSSARYHHRIVDATPAVFDALAIPYGHTAAGIAYGRAQVTLEALP